MATSAAPLRGLVLAGGASRRMGRDKGSLRYHGRDQRSHCRALLARHCAEVFISCRRDQARLLRPGQAAVWDAADLPAGAGPAAGLLSARRIAPESAWLVLACDMPGVDDGLLARLLEGRDPSARATAFRGPSGLPEPLFAVWEPRGLALLARRARRGRLAPRDVLREDCALLAAPETWRLAGVNTPGERRRFRRSAALNAASPRGDTAATGHKPIKPRCAVRCQGQVPLR